MKRLIASSILSAGALFGMTSEAEAGRADHQLGPQGESWSQHVPSRGVDSCGLPRRGIEIGYGGHGDERYRGRGYRNRRGHDHRRVCYERVWVPPCYRQVFAGYDHCGHPIYRRVMMHAGYWKTVRRYH